MRKKRKSCQRIVVFGLFFLICLVNSWFLNYEVFAQERPLEVKYPEMEGIKPETVEIGIIKYVKYIFNFVIIISGIIALGALIWAGIHYLTSTGKPEELQKAKKQIWAALLGILILLFSYLILTTINPQLVILQLPELKPITYPAPSLPPAQPPTEKTPLGRIAEIAQNLKTAVEGIKYYAQEIRNLTENCSCTRTDSMCLCQQYQGGSCKPVYCYIGPSDSHPCPDWENIKEYQQKIIAFKNEIVYYKNRIESEREDLLFEIDQLQKKIAYYEEKIKVEKQVLTKIPAEETARENQEKLISALEEIKKDLELELNIKLTVVDNLDILISSIINLSDLIIKLAEPPNSLIDSCWQKVKEICRGQCEGGCHDIEGCFSKKCQDGNPCQINEIENTVNKIKTMADQIIEICEDIFSAHQIITPPPVPPPVPPSCESAGGICVEKGKECPADYYSSEKFVCKEEKVCCLPKTAVSCQCSASPYKGCVNLNDYGITTKHGRYTDRTLAEKLVAFQTCLARNGITGWRVTEACPPTYPHKSACHYINGKCLDADRGVLCGNQSQTEQCLRQIGLGAINECACSSPHYHIDLTGRIQYLCR